MDAIYCERTSTNFRMLFATWAANFILVIGRRFAVKSVIGIYEKYEFDVDQMSPGGFTFDCQGEQPTN